MDTRRCNYPACQEGSALLRRRKGEEYYLDDLWFCSEPCVRQQAAHNLARIDKLAAPPSNGFIPRPKLPLLLLTAGAVTRTQLDLATQALTQTRRGTLASWLIKLGYTSEREITRALCRQFGLPFVELSHAQINKSALSLLPLPIIGTARVLPLDFNEEKKEVTLAFGAQVELAITRVITKILGCGVNPIIGDEPRVVDHIRNHYGLSLQPYDAPAAKPLADVPAAEWARRIIDGAKPLGANTLFFEPYNHLVWVRYIAPGRSQDVIIDRSQEPVVTDKVG